MNLTNQEWVYYPILPIRSEYYHNPPIRSEFIIPFHQSGVSILTCCWHWQCICSLRWASWQRLQTGDPPWSTSEVLLRTALLFVILVPLVQLWYSSLHLECAYSEMWAPGHCAADPPHHTAAVETCSCSVYWLDSDASFIFSVTFLPNVRTVSPLWQQATIQLSCQHLRIEFQYGSTQPKCDGRLKLISIFYKINTWVSTW